MLKKIILAGLLILLAGTGGLAFSFGIDSPSIHLETWPGETSTAELMVYNLSENPLDIKVSVEDWKCREDGTKQFLAKGTGPYSCGNWLEPEMNSFTLAPLEK